MAPDWLEPILERAAGRQKFWNHSAYDLRRLAEGSGNVELNFLHYSNGFSPSVQDILENHQLDKVVARLLKNGLLYQLVQINSRVQYSCTLHSIELLT